MGIGRFSGVRWRFQILMWRSFLGCWQLLKNKRWFCISQNNSASGQEKSHQKDLAVQVLNFSSSSFWPPSSPYNYISFNSYHGFPLAVNTSTPSTRFPGRVWFGLKSSTWVLERFTWLFLQRPRAHRVSEIICLSFVTLWTWVVFFFVFQFSVQEVSKLSLLDRSAPSSYNLWNQQDLLVELSFITFRFLTFSMMFAILHLVLTCQVIWRANLTNKIRSPAWKDHILKQRLSQDLTAPWSGVHLGKEDSSPRCGTFSDKCWLSCRLILSAVSLPEMFLFLGTGCLSSVGVGEWRLLSRDAIRGMGFSMWSEAR